MSLDLAVIRAARERIRPHVVRTPVLTSEAIDAECGGRIFFKCENLQATGAFKDRGACNAVFSLGEREAAGGVVAHSSGNHAAALARAARRRGIPARIVVPNNAPKVKLDNIRRNGGEIVLCEPNLEAREKGCAALAAETGAVIVPPFNYYPVMAGQGTATLELLEDVPDVDAVLCPIGGGGLACGTSVAAKETRGSISVIGVEPAAADDLAQSFRAGRRVAITSAPTIADGLRTNCTGELNFPIIQKYLDDIVTISEESIIRAMRRLWEALHVVVEPSGAVPFAAILEGKVPVAGRRVAIIISGGNVDLGTLPWNNS